MFPNCWQEQDRRLTIMAQMGGINSNGAFLVSYNCLISPWGQSWERVFHKHKCIQFIARVPKIVPMAKLDIHKEILLNILEKVFFAATLLKRKRKRLAGVCIIGG